MKRWLLLALAVVIVVTSALALYLHSRATSSVPRPQAHLVLVPNSAYNRYQLCVEAFAFTSPFARSSYKTDFTFHDPFRHADDTVIPLLLGRDKQGTSVSFSVQIIVNQVATFNETISHVKALDGISILLPNAHDSLERSTVPQIIIRMLTQGLAILDYTCPEQWVWKAA